jgi:hypothetical protein
LYDKILGDLLVYKENNMAKGMSHKKEKKKPKKAKK